MKGSDDAEFKVRLKQLILDACGKDSAPEEIDDRQPLFGEDSSLELDSIDGLQISMALQREFGVRISDSKKLRRILSSIDSLADFLQPD